MLRFFLYRTPVLILTLYIRTTQSANPQLALIPTSEEGGLRAPVWSIGKQKAVERPTNHPTADLHVTACR